MTIDDFIEHYGFKTASLMIKNHIRRYPADSSSSNAMMLDMANALEKALKDYVRMEEEDYI